MRHVGVECLNDRSHHIVAVFLQIVIGVAAFVIDSQTATQIQEAHLSALGDQLVVVTNGLHDPSTNVSDIGNLRAQMEMQQA